MLSRGYAWKRSKIGNFNTTSRVQVNQVHHALSPPLSRSRAYFAEGKYSIEDLVPKPQFGWMRFFILVSVWRPLYVYLLRPFPLSSLSSLFLSFFLFPFRGAEFAPFFFESTKLLELASPLFSTFDNHVLRIYKGCQPDAFGKLSRLGSSKWDSLELCQSIHTGSNIGDSWLGSDCTDDDFCRGSNLHKGVHQSESLLGWLSGTDCASASDCMY